MEQHDFGPESPHIYEALQMKHMLKPASCMFTTHHMLPLLHVSSRRHEASGFPLRLHTHTHTHTCSTFTVSPLKNDVPVPLWQEISIYALGALVLSAYFPSYAHSQDPVCMIAVNIPVYICIRLCVCALLVFTIQ